MKLTGELKKIIAKKDRVVDMVADGLLDKAEVKQKMEKLREQEQHIQARLVIIETEISNVPDPQHVKRLSKLGMQVISDATRNRPQAIFKKSYEWRRRLIEHAFSGRDTQRGRLGVYIQQTDDEQSWQFEIRGAIESMLLALPLSDEFLIDVFKLDSDFQDVSKELEKIKTNFSRHWLSQPLHIIAQN